MNCPTNHSNRLEFKYDSQGRRISKDVYSSQSLWSKVESLSFVYDGWNLISEVRSQGSEVSTNFYTWGLDLSQSLQGAGGVGGLLSVTVAGGDDPGTFIPCFDANGNITEYVDEDGTVAAHYEYDPYGNITKALGLTPNAFSHRFSTKYFDAETGYYYYGYRYYSSELGRWLNRDPIEERGGLNLYGFVKNSTITSIDVLGLGLNDPPPCSFKLCGGLVMPDDAECCGGTIVTPAEVSAARASCISSAESVIDGLPDPPSSPALDEACNTYGHVGMTGGLDPENQRDEFLELCTLLIIGNAMVDHEALQEYRAERDAAYSALRECYTKEACDFF